MLLANDSNVYYHQAKFSIDASKEVEHFHSIEHVVKVKPADL